MVSWQQAFTLIYSKRVDVVEYYEGQIVRTPKSEFQVPSVIRYKSGGHKYYIRTRMSRGALLRRDNYRCAYCEKRLNYLTVTKDHVMPSSRGGKDIWENIVSCCFPCNNYKGDRTPEEAGLTLKRVPTKPLYAFAHRVIEQWKPYVFSA